MRDVTIVYWDFDGVLRPTQSNPRLTRDGFDPSCIAVANAVHAATGALAVVSSTWRRDQRCRQIMADNGFAAALLDANWMTPDDRDGHRDRCDDVDAHMAQCARMGYRIRGFAIVDDLYGPLPAHHAPHLVSTDPRHGVTPSHIGMITAALGVAVSGDCYAA